MIVVLYSPKFDEIVLVEKAELLGETQFLIESSTDFGLVLDEYKRSHRIDILMIDDWVFLGAL